MKKNSWSFEMRKINKGLLIRTLFTKGRNFGLFYRSFVINRIISRSSPLFGQYDRREDKRNFIFNQQ